MSDNAPIVLVTPGLLCNLSSNANIKSSSSQDADFIGARWRRRFGGNSLLGVLIVDVGSVITFSEASH
jgi:hypothetical protein